MEKEVFARDDYTCQVCGKRGTHLEAHHLKSFAEFPNYDLNYQMGKLYAGNATTKLKKVDYVRRITEYD